MERADPARRPARAAAPSTALAAACCAAGCDPVIDVEGSFFPAWLLCLVAGIVLAVLGRKLFAALDLEPYLGPLVVVYPSLALLMTLVVWLVFFRA